MSEINLGTLGGTDGLPSSEKFELMKLKLQMQEQMQMQREQMQLQIQKEVEMQQIQMQEKEIKKKIRAEKGITLTGQETVLKETGM